jgi:hypothetical protein
LEDFKNYLPKGVKPIYEMAMPDKFEEQCANSEIVWIKGGDDILLQFWLKQFKPAEIWQGKVVAVSSASSDAVVKHFWTGDWRGLMNGLGLVPIKFIAHYKSSYGNDDPRGPIDWEAAKKELAGYGDPNLPIYTLEEGDYVVFEV